MPNGLNGTVLNSKTLMPIIWVIGIAGACISFGMQLQGIRNNVNKIPQMQTDLSTALGVLKDHGTEIEDVRKEQLRLRIELDTWQSAIIEKTKDRFHKSDFDRWLKEEYKTNNKN